MGARLGFLSFLLAGGILEAQPVPLGGPAPLGGPVVAYTFDAPTASFRAVLGWLGSSYFGPALLPGIDFGSVAAHRNYGIAVSNGKGLVVLGLGSDRVSTVELQEPFSVPEAAAWSDDGSSVVLYSRSGNWIQTVQGLPDAPHARSPLGIAPLGGSISVAAVSPHADHIVIGVLGTGVFEATADQNFVPLLALEKPAALVFSADAATLFALDGARRELSTLNWQDRTTQTWPLSGLQDPFAIRTVPGPSSDQIHPDQILYVASRADRLLATFDISSHQPIATMELGFEPTGIEPLGRESYTLAARVHEDDPLWTLVNAPAPAVYFVPATPLPSTLSNNGGRP